MNSESGTFFETHAGLCLQSRLSWSRSAKTTQAGVFLLRAWWSPAPPPMPCWCTPHADSSSSGGQQRNSVTRGRCAPM